MPKIVVFLLLTSEHLSFHSQEDDKNQINTISSTRKKMTEEINGIAE